MKLPRDLELRAPGGGRATGAPSARPESAGPLAEFLKRRWLSLVMILAYGFIVYLLSNETSIVFLGLLAVIFALEAESRSERRQETRRLEERLDEISARLDRQTISTSVREDSSDATGNASGPQPP